VNNNDERYKMNYLEMMRQQPAEREALVEDGISFSYGDLVRLAQGRAQEWQEHRIQAHQKFSPPQRIVHVIMEKRILHQLVSFLACFLTEEIPLIVPWDSEYFHRDERRMAGNVPERACVAVATSGTSGTPKIYFRTYESWAGYFPIQNEIFHIHRDSRLFVQGSLSFTGNMNLYLAQFSVGAAVIAENEFHPENWEKRLEKHRANGIYLIPAKLLLLPRLMKNCNSRIETIISGSQSLGKSDAEQLKAVFPKAKIVLYYGATELNYMTYVTDDMMTEQRNLIGKPFPKVEVYVENEEIFINTAYHVEGITCPYTLSDRGTMDEGGNLYFLGRSDDILLHRGHKVSAVKLENLLLELDGVEEAAVCTAKHSHWKEEKIVAYLLLSPSCTLKEQEILSALRTRLHRYELPRRIFFVESLPKNASGKVDKRQLSVLECYYSR